MAMAAALWQAPRHGQTGRGGGSVSGLEANISKESRENGISSGGKAIAAQLPLAWQRWRHHQCASASESSS